MTDFVVGGMILGTVLWSVYSAWCAYASGDARLCDAHVTAALMGVGAGLMLYVSILLKRLVEFQDGLIKRLYVAALRMQVKLDRRDGADGDK